VDDEPDPPRGLGVAAELEPVTSSIGGICVIPAAPATVERLTWNA
jgi:hypothetical protein